MPALNPTFWLFPGIHGTWKSDFVYPIPNCQLSWPGFDTTIQNIIQHFKPFFTITIHILHLNVNSSQVSFLKWWNCTSSISNTATLSIYIYERKVPWIMKMTFFVKNNFIKIFQNKVLPREKTYWNRHFDFRRKYDSIRYHGEIAVQNSETIKNVGRQKSATLIVYCCNLYTPISDCCPTFPLELKINIC